MRPTTTCGRPTRGSQGFSLVELMMVVTIVGVLAAIGIPSLQDYVYKARTSEAIDFLGTIRLREESYRSEYGTYISTMPTANGPAGVTELATGANLVPDPNTTAGSQTVPFLDGGGVVPAAWQQLGAHPAGTVRFGYGVAAGDPAAANLPPAAFGMTAANADFWFVAQAITDLDGDGEFCTFESFSATKGIFIHDSADNEIPKGWE